ncbi:ogr/Delta-like zinc finger family protein [Hafnia paralvei]|uniref:ogr/Delta-like zinc finger family protein n=1 Tax=Hafnia paralvei TaxID=546367 RepID=UPI00300CA706
MMRCSRCGCAAHARSSREITMETKERYHQCTNINCGHTFVTMESYIRSIMVPGVVTTAPPHPNKNNQPSLIF